jgi:hypothetical protein
LKTKPVVKHYGYEMFEGRVNRIMKRYKVTREEAVERIYAHDLGEDFETQDQ